MPESKRTLAQQVESRGCRDDELIGIDGIVSTWVEAAAGSGRSARINVVETKTTSDLIKAGP